MRATFRTQFQISENQEMENDKEDDVFHSQPDDDQFKVQSGVDSFVFLLRPHIPISDISRLERNKSFVWSAIKIVPYFNTFTTEPCF